MRKNVGIKIVSIINHINLLLIHSRHHVDLCDVIKKVLSAAGLIPVWLNASK
jgi:hypothetical protein